MIVRRHAFFKYALILFCVFFIFPISCKINGNDREDGSRTFPAEQLQADFTQMRQALENNHPDRLRYETAATLSSLFDAAYDSIRNDMSEIEFFRLVAPLVTRYHCGHTIIRPSAAFSPGLVMPLGIYLADGQAHVDADYGSMSGIPLGSEVLSINGEPIAAIVDRMMAGISSDALNTSAKIQRLKRNFFLYYYYFWGEMADFDFRVKDPASGAESVVRVNARAYTLVSGEVSDRFAVDSRLSLEINGNLAVMTVPSFVIAQNQNYLIFFEDSFMEMNASGVKHLIIDIRGNGGGDPQLSVALIAHLANEPFIYLKKGLGYDNLFEATVPHTVHFSGTVQVLIDGGCFSTSGHFCSIVRYHGLAVFVGETGGGTFRCHDNSRDFVLDNTGIRLRVARTTYEAAVPDHDVSEGFPPDFRVVPTIQDILAGTDVQMDYAVRMTEAGN